MYVVYEICYKLQGSVKNAKKYKKRPIFMKLAPNFLPNENSHKVS